MRLAAVDPLATYSVTEISLKFVPHARPDETAIESTGPPVDRFFPLTSRACSTISLSALL